MKQLLLSIWLISLASSSFIAQTGDTTVIQTLEFSDITKRRGWYVFPPDTASYEKILMYYTLKCDAATTQDALACGEWDYSTFTNLYQPKNIGDTIFHQGNSQPDTIFYATSTGEDIYRKKQYQRVEDAQTAENIFPVTTGGSAGNNILGANKTHHSQFVISANDLTTAGLTAGNIDKLELNIPNGGSAIPNMVIRLKNTALTEVTPSSFETTGMTEVLNSNLTTVAGSNEIFLTTTFNWDGTSNLAIDISHTGSNNNTLMASEVSTFYNSGISTNQDNGYLDFSGDDYVEVPSNGLSSLSNEITISFWCKGNLNNMPMNSYLLEGRDASGNRVVNIHLPWSNSNVYWDCGNAGTGSYDRVNALANLSDFAGEWNHWAFTKNATTGDMTIYLNGTVFASASGMTRDLSTITSFKIGGNTTSPLNGQYEGAIDELRIWNTELSATDIQDYMYQSIGITHPNYANLLLAYSFDDLSGNVLTDYSLGGSHGTLMGLPNWHLHDGGNNNFDFNQLTALPEISFIQGTYTSHLDSTIVADTIAHSQFQVIKDLSYLDINVSGVSATRVDTVLHNDYRTSYTYDENGNKVDSTLATIAGFYTNSVSSTLHQIQNYVTPYGIGLNLNGTNGFRWVYDVTDYEPILHDTVEFSAGNQQELIDVKFVFVKGTPPREVLDFKTIWVGNYQHADIANDIAMPAVDVDIIDTAQQVIVRTRATGHWFGGFQNCAEFCPKDNNLKVNGTQTHEWTNWKKCANNPVKSQGGTWVYDRAGWCPGTFADTYDHDITSFVTTGQTNSIDYGMETTAGGMEGNYQTTVQMVQYGAPNFQVDARVEDIIAPNNWEFHQNYNPMCDEPKILVRNTGADDITSLTIGYWICGGPVEYYTWTGNLSFMDTTSVTLPLPDPSFWDHANYCKIFNTTIFQVNGQLDEYRPNDHMSSEFDSPPTIPGDLIIWYKTNNNPTENELYLYDDQDNIVYQNLSTTPNLQYKDTIALSPGCYKVVLTDSGEDGLNFFASSQGAGSLMLRKVGAGLHKVFDPDFGSELIYYFTSGYTLSTDELTGDVSANIYPNPNTGSFSLETDGFMGELTLEIYNTIGELITSDTRYLEEVVSTCQFEWNDLPAGHYMVKLSDGNNTRIVQMVKQ
jgi:hypothetical protein